MTIGIDSCANCGAAIGKLETPFVWKDSIVCASCHPRLQNAAKPAPLVAMPIPVGPLGGNVGRHFPAAKGPTMLCNNPNCGYHGPMLKKAKGSTIILLLLLLLWIVPGLVYLMVYNGFTLTCPACGTKVGEQSGI